MVQIAFLLFFGLHVISCEERFLNTLILHSNVDVLETHTEFLNLLKGLGHKVRILNTEDVDASVVLKNYSNLIIFSGKDSSLNSDDLTKFLDNGGNAMIIADTYSGSGVRKLINQVGFFLISPGSYVISPTKAIIDSYTVPLDVSESLLPSDGIFHTIPYGSPLFYRGSALKYDKSNKNIINILVPTQYDVLYNEVRKTYNPAIVNGLPLTLVGACEMNNKKRVLVVPSVEFFSDQFVNVVHQRIKGLEEYQKTSNNLVIQQLVEWNFNQIGSLRISNVQHYLVRTGQPSQQYTVMEEIVYKLKIQVKSYNGWVPFVSKNIFFELHRIQNHARLQYNVTEDGTYSVQFHIPDFIGIYKCMTLFDKPGFTVLDHYEQIVVRPRRHNEFQRFVVKFWPFYFTTFLMMGLTFVMLYAVVHVKVKAD